MELRALSGMAAIGSGGTAGTWHAYSTSVGVKHKLLNTKIETKASYIV